MRGCVERGEGEQSQGEHNLCRIRRLSAVCFSILFSLYLLNARALELTTLAARRLAPSARKTKLAAGRN